MSVEQKFNAAVKLIQALPKSGSFKPSDDLRLQYYGLFKQATEGPNPSAKPAFYDLIGKYKWEAWNKLGDMSKEDAMQAYINLFVDSLKPMTVEDSDKDIFELLAPFKEHLPQESQLILTKHNF